MRGRFFFSKRGLRLRGNESACGDKLFLLSQKMWEGGWFFSADKVSCFPAQFQKKKYQATPMFGGPRRDFVSPTAISKKSAFLLLFWDWENRCFCQFQAVFCNFTRKLHHYISYFIQGHVWFFWEKLLTNRAIKYLFPQKII